MLRVTFELKDDVNVKDFLSVYSKDKRVKKVTVTGANKAAKQTAEHYMGEEPVTTAQFKARIKKAEKEIKEGKKLTETQMMAKHEAWKKKQGLTK